MRRRITDEQLRFYIASRIAFEENAIERGITRIYRRDVAQMSRSQLIEKASSLNGSATNVVDHIKATIAGDGGWKE